MSELENDLSALPATRKSGNEQFSFDGTPTGLRLLDFWQWSDSGLIGNTFPGMLAEYIVACDLGVETGTRIEWDAYDLITRDGVKVEVKSSAYLQSWHQTKPSRIEFSICPARAWDAATNILGIEVKRQADVYVFCLLGHMSKSTLNPMDFNQWEFFVLPTSVLDTEVPLQKKIGLGGLLKLGPIKAAYGSISQAINQCLHPDAK